MPVHGFSENNLWFGEPTPIWTNVFSPPFKFKIYHHFIENIFNHRTSLVYWSLHKYKILVMWGQELGLKSPKEALHINTLRLCYSYIKNKNK